MGRQTQKSKWKDLGPASTLSSPPQQRQRAKSHQLFSCKVMFICSAFPWEAYIGSQAWMLHISKIEMGPVIKN